jgi:hypothetical protein
MRQTQSLFWFALAVILGPAAFPAQGALTSAGALPHFASGGGWKTTWILVNSTSNSNAAVQLNFIGDNGSPLTIPLTDALTGLAMTPASTYSVSLRSFGLLAVETTSTDASATTGWVQVSTDSSTTTVLETFDYTSLPLSGIVNLQRGGAIPQLNATATGYMLAFNEVGKDYVAIAIANLTNNTISVNVTTRNFLGTTKATHTLTLTAQQHRAFLVSQEYPETEGVLGTIEFYAGSPNQIAVMGLSFNGTNYAFTSNMSIPTTAVQ